MAKDILHTGEVAKILGLPPRTVTQLARKKVLLTLERLGGEGYYRYPANRIMELKERWSESAEIPSISGTQPKGPRKEYDWRYRDHWHRVGKVAEVLKLDLEFPSRYVMKKADSRFGGIVATLGYFNASGVSFSAEQDPLWECLLQHLDSEFEKPLFSEQLKKLQELATNLVRDDPGRAFEKAANHTLAQRLRKKLWLVVERGAFKGTCDICRDWD